MEDKKEITFNPTHKLILCTGILSVPSHAAKRLFLDGEKQNQEFCDRIKDVVFPISFEEAGEEY